MLNTYSLWKKNRKLEGFVKPAAMVFLILGVISFGVQLDAFPARMIFFIAALFLCLLGDIFLFLPPEKYFQKGLIAFLLGHVGYILGFGWGIDVRYQIIPILVFFLLLAIINSQIAIKIIHALRKSGRERLVIPIIVYSITISAMVFLAGLRYFDADWAVGDAYLVALGALAFFISDVLNAWRRFVQKFSYDRIVIMGLYHLGQYAIGIGVIHHFVN
ncbi:MAG: lysoplasmalogenase [Anaerolineales bacterium]